MIQSFVLRLVAEPLADGRIAGHVEAVESGRTQAITNGDELLAFLIAVGAQPGASEAERAAAE